MTTLARAAASYHGIPLDVIVRTDVHTGDDGVLYLTVQIPIKDDDLGPIVKRMGQLAEQAQDQQHMFVHDDPMQLKQLREDWAALTPAQRGEHKSFARYKAYREAEQFEADGLPGTWIQAGRGSKSGMAGDLLDAMIAEERAGGGDPLAEYASAYCAGMEGIGGRKVQHVDVPEQQEADIELPAAVWVDGWGLDDMQRRMASDERSGTGGAHEYLIQVDMLTAEQKAKYCEEQKS